MDLWSWLAACLLGIYVICILITYVTIGKVIHLANKKGCLTEFSKTMLIAFIILFSHPFFAPLGVWFSYKLRKECFLFSEKTQ